MELEPNAYRHPHLPNLDLDGAITLDSIRQALMFLRDRYNIDFVLTAACLHPVTGLNNGCHVVYNADAHFKNMETMREWMQIVCDRIAALPAILNRGVVVVRCLDDSNQPESGDRVSRTTCYMVEEMQPVVGRPHEFIYKLRDMHPAPPETGYSSKRFEVVYPSMFLS